MGVPDVAVRRPITVLMATLAVVVFGWIAARGLPVELLPDLSYPTLTVQTVYPDAAPASVELFVTRPIEEAVGVIPGVQSVRSVSRAGLSEVVLEFGWTEPMDFAALDVREKLGLVTLPREVEQPRVLRYDPSLDPVLRLSLSADVPLGDLRTAAERWLGPRLEGVIGVAAAKVRGGLDPEVHVEADEDRLAALGLSLADVVAALNAENVNQPGGTLRDWGSVYLVRTLHEFTTLAQVQDTIVHESGGGTVRVGDVAQVTRGHAERDEITRTGGRETVEIDIHREGSANTVAVSRAVRAELELLQAEMSAGWSLTVLSDQSRFIGEAITQVWSSAAIGGALAILVLFFFLRDPLPTAVIALSMPVSVLATFLAIGQAGVSINVMSLGGLALGVGMLVDTSIVVLEAIDRQRQAGLSRRAAAMQGATEVAGAVTASTLTTVAVFIPIVFVEGVAGQLFRDLALTVCLSLLASLVVSLTLVPALAGLAGGSGFTASVERAPAAGKFPWTVRWLGHELAPVGGGVSALSRVATLLLLLPRLVILVLTAALAAVWWLAARSFDAVAWPLMRVFDGIVHAYPPLLEACLRGRFLVIALALALFGVALVGLKGLGTDLVPEVAQGHFAFRLRLAEGTTLSATSEVVERIETALAGTPSVEHVFAVVGSHPSTASGKQTLGENLAQVDLALLDSADAEAEAAAIARARDVLLRFPTVEAELARPSVLTLAPPIVINVFSDDLTRLDEAAEQVAVALRGLPELSDIATTSEPGSPEIRIELDHERASALGVSGEDISRALRRQVRGELAGELRESEHRLPIRVRGPARSRDRASGVESLRVQLPHGASVPVAAVARVEVGRGPAAIHRTGGSRVAQISAQASAADLGATITKVKRALAGVALQGGAVAEMAGRERELALSFGSLRLALLLATFLVYVVMAMQFESLLHPFVILLSVPLGVVGVVAALLVTGTTVSVLVLIGAVMLAGIVVNNAIILVDAVNRRRREGIRIDDALLQAGRERLRPILMTTGTTVLALVPMALGLGAGDELRAPLAITVIGGLAGASLLTLLVIPCLYRALSRDAALVPTVAPPERSGSGASAC